MSWTSKGVICSLEAFTVPSLATFQQRGSGDVEQTTVEQRPTIWPWPLTMWTKIIRVIYSLGSSTVPSLVIFKQKSQKIFSRHHLNKDLQFDLDLWPYDLKNNKSHLLSEGIHFIKLGNFQVKGSKDIERKSLGLKIDRPTDRCKTIWPLFPKEGIIKHWILIIDYFFSQKDKDNTYKLINLNTSNILHVYTDHP